MYLYFGAKYNVKIFHRYLETGHTHNECDNIHSVIERTGNMKEFFTPEEWYSHIENCKEEGNKYKMLRFCDLLQDFHSLADNHFRWDTRRDIRMEHIRDAMFDPKKNGSISIQHSFTEDRKEILVGKVDPHQRRRGFRADQLQAPASI